MSSSTNMLHNLIPRRSEPIVPLRAASTRSMSTRSSNLRSRTQPNAEDYEISQILGTKKKVFRTSTCKARPHRRTKRRREGVPYTEPRF